MAWQHPATLGTRELGFLAAAHQQQTSPVQGLGAALSPLSELRHRELLLKFSRIPQTFDRELSTREQSR